MALYQYLERFFRFLDGGRNNLVSLLIDNRLVKKLVERQVLTPNGLTMFRLVTTIVLSTHVLTGYWLTRALTFLEQSKWFMFGLFLTGSLSDSIDGPLSRIYSSLFSDEDRRYGLNFDRHVDKIFTSAPMLIYWPVYDNITRSVVTMMIGGDLLATGLAVFASKSGISIPSNALGKAKMVLQCIGVGAVILRFPAFVVQYAMVAGFTLGVASLTINITLARRQTAAK
jgi:phosphatidylglycerophosphate synthase